MLREPYAAAGLVAGLPCILFDGGFRLREFHSMVGHLATIREAHSERGGALMGLVIVDGKRSDPDPVQTGSRAQSEGPQLQALVEEALAELRDRLPSDRSVPTASCWPIAH